MDSYVQGGGISYERIVEGLLKGAYITEKDLEAAQKYVEEGGDSLIEYLLAKQLITRDILGQAVAESYGVSYADLNSNIPSKEQQFAIPDEMAHQYRIVLFSQLDSGIVIATDRPRQEGLTEKIKALFPQVPSITITYSLSEDIDDVLRMYQKSLATRFSKIVEAGGRVAPELVDEIIGDALSLRASDIHFEPGRHDVLVRFRIDDVLQQAGRIPKEYYENIVNRIKVLAHLRTDEHQAAQDGAIRYSREDLLVDLRVSVAPIVDGEKIAIRLLSQYVQSFSLANLGLRANEQDMVKEAASSPFGMILVTGPTGSGKTTTLYAIMKMLNHPDVNITTIEDPVEYKLEGVNHIQVNSRTNLTFARGLRSIVRQDPDIILVGEIRDEETAEIAVNAALTGHLLLSTFHANDAATAIPRLLDMAIEPFLLASTLEAIVAQRLVRKICERCRASIAAKEVFNDANVSRAVQKQFSETKTLYHGKGCTVCNNTGYEGRTAIFEIIRITPSIKELILKRPSTQEVWHLAHKEGSRSMFDDGIEKVKEGVTTVQELLRVAQPPE